jgi:hypothetical protein
MEMKADNAHVLMSEVLRGQVPELESEHPVDQLAHQHVVVIAEKIIGGKTEGMVGVLRGILLGTDPEIEFRAELKEALEILKANNLSFSRFELHLGETLVVPIPGPFIVKAARIDEISPQDQLCTLGLHLTRPAR